MSSTSRILHGLSVLVLRPEHQAGDLVHRLAELGAGPVVVPAIEIVAPDEWGPIDMALSEASSFDWLVFTSVNGVEMIAERLGSARGLFADPEVSVAAIGPATASALEGMNASNVWLPSAFTTHALAMELPLKPTSTGMPARVCLFRADIADGLLEKGLSSRGFHVERVNAYGTRPINEAQIKEAIESVNAVALTSASIVDSLASAVSLIPEDVFLYSIGPATTRACAKHGFKVKAEAKVHTLEGLVDVIQHDSRSAKL